jgi:hypothetical protein
MKKQTAHNIRRDSIKAILAIFLFTIVFIAALPSFGQPGRSQEHFNPAKTYKYDGRFMFRHITVVEPSTTFNFPDSSYITLFETINATASSTKKKSSTLITFRPSGTKTNTNFERVFMVEQTGSFKNEKPVKSIRVTGINPVRVRYITVPTLQQMKDDSIGRRYLYSNTYQTDKSKPTKPPVIKKAVPKKPTPKKPIPKKTAPKKVVKK